MQRSPLGGAPKRGGTAAQIHGYSEGGLTQEIDQVTYPIINVRFLLQLSARGAGLATGTIRVVSRPEALPGGKEGGDRLSNLYDSL